MSWYKMKALSNSSAEIDIEGEIGWEVTARQFKRDLKDLGAVDEITLKLNSPGGSVYQGMAIYEALREHPAKVVVQITSMAASMGSIIAQAGDEVYMSDVASFMIHNPSDYVYGSEKEFRSAAEKLKTIKSTMIAAYTSRKKLKMDEAELSEAMDDETWYTAAEAAEAGFVDFLTEKEDTSLATFDLRTFRNVPDHVKALHSDEIKSGSHVAKTNEDSMSTFTQAELDAAVRKAVDSANASAKSEASKELKERYSKLRAHANGSNTKLVDRLAASDMSIEDALGIMEDAGTAEESSGEPQGNEAEGEGAGATFSPDAFAKAVSEATAAAIQNLRASESGTTDLPASGGGGGDQPSDPAADAAAKEEERVKRANERRSNK